MLETDDVKEHDVYLSDTDLAKMLLASCGGGISFSDRRGFMAYNGKFWFDDGASAEVSRRIAAFCDTVHSGKRAVRSNIKTINDIKSCLSHIAYATGEEMTPPKYLLNCANGVIHLKDGTLLPHNKDYFFTGVAPFNYRKGINYSAWEKRIMGILDDRDSAMALQRAFGYSLTGETNMHKVFVLQGPGRSGKSMTMNLFRDLLGGLCRTLPKASITEASRMDNQNFALSGLEGGRVVTINELDGEKIQTAKVKLLSGGDAISAAYKGRDKYSYLPQFKLWIVSNEELNAKSDDDSFWRRLMVFKYPKGYIGKEDYSVIDQWRSRENMEMVLAWGVQGAIDFYRENQLIEAAAVEASKEELRMDVDFTTEWIALNIVKIRGAKIFSSDLYKAYVDYCTKIKSSPITRAGLVRRIVTIMDEPTCMVRKGDVVSRGFHNLDLLL